LKSEALFQAHRHGNLAYQTEEGRALDQQLRAGIFLFREVPKRLKIVFGNIERRDTARPLEGLKAIDAHLSVVVERKDNWGRSVGRFARSPAQK